MITLKDYFTEYMGFPVDWFEPCSHSDADGGIGHDGKIYMDGGHKIPFRMKDKYRKRAGW